MKTRHKLPEPEQYAHDILSGKIPACKWVKLACQRHFDDLKNGGERGLWFDPAAGQKVIDFFRFTKHSKGEWAGQVFVLSPWQQFCTWVIFGWKKKDGTRRFRTAYIEVARKNGKSTWFAGIGNYLLVADGEAGAEVYNAATKRDQARIIHSEATRMIKSSPGLRKRVTIYRDNLCVESTNSKYEPLGADSDTMDGLNPHGCIIDELHAHKTRGVWDILDTATGSRRQPLQAAITTAGFDTHSVCYEQHEYVEKILERIVEDDTYFGIIYTIDGEEKDGDTIIREEDDWTAEETWSKANPNYGISVKPDDLKRKCKQAREMPAKQNAFKRLHLDIWTEAETLWLNMDKWKICNSPVDTEGLRGRRCYGGLDLSKSQDVSAWVMVFPPETEDDFYRVVCRFFIPQDNMEKRVKKNRVPYDVWVRQGFITATPGNVIDYDFILEQIDQDARAYDIEEIAFDRWGAANIIQKLQEKEIEVIEFGQGFASMSAPALELERLVLGEKLAHGGNPVLTWMAKNVVARQDPAGNIKPDKEKSREKIDGIVALIMATGRAMRNKKTESGNDGSLI